MINIKSKFDSTITVKIEIVALPVFIRSSVSDSVSYRKRIEINRDKQVLSPTNLHATDLFE